MYVFSLQLFFVGPFAQTVSFGNRRMLAILNQMYFYLLG